MGVSDSEAEIAESERKNKRSGIRWRGLNMVKRALSVDC